MDIIYSLVGRALPNSSTSSPSTCIQTVGIPRDARGTGDKRRTVHLGDSVFHSQEFSNRTLLLLLQTRCLSSCEAILLVADAKARQDVGAFSP